ncbi:MAG: hypothetical protein WAL63_06605 [Solirubrobacteraceae bacterium]
MSAHAQGRRIAVAGVLAALAAAVIGVAALARAATPHASAPAPGAVTARTEAENRGAAERDARRLLHRAPLPAGATPSASEPLGDGGLLDHPGVQAPAEKLVDDHVFSTVTAPLQTVRHFVQTHAPAGSRLTGTGASEGPNVPANAAFSFAFRWRPAGVGSRALSVGLVALAPGITGVRVDAQDVWLVPRSRFERVPRGVHTLQITRSSWQTGPGITEGFAITFTITDRAEIDQITRWIDALPVVAPGVTSCPSQPLHPSPPQVRFAFLSASGKPLATAAEDANVREPTTPCDAMTFTVCGRAQPALLNGAQFLAHIDQLLHLHLSSGGLGLGTGRK